MRECKYCGKEIPHKQRKSHECDEYLEYLDRKDMEAANEERDKRLDRLFHIAGLFTEEQCDALIALVDHMLQENF